MNQKQTNFMNTEYLSSFTGTEYFRDDVKRVIHELRTRLLDGDEWYKTRPQSLEQDKKNLTSLLKQLKKNKNGFYINPEYFRKNTGRYYVKGVCSLQKFCGKIRNTLIDRTQYSDLDIVNCCPSILKNITDLWDIPNAYITKYCESRDEMMKECMEKMNLSKGVVKTLFIRLMFGGSYGAFISDTINEYPEFKTDYEIEWLKPLFDELKNIANTLFNDPRCEAIKKAINQKKRDDPSQGIKVTNKVGSFLSHLLFTVENFIIHLVRDFVGKNGFVMDSLIFDGGLIRLRSSSKDTPKVITEKLINDCQTFIYHQTSLNIKLKVKEFDEFYGDDEIYADEKDIEGTETINGVEFERSYLYDGVRDDADVAEKLLKICPGYFKYCKGTLYGFNSEIGMWNTSGSHLVRFYVHKYSKMFRIYKTDKDGDEYISDETYGRNERSLKKIAPIMEILTMDDLWLERTELSSMGYLLFKNGIYCFKDNELYEFDPNIVFHNRIDMDYIERDEKTDKWALKVHKILFSDPFCEGDEQGSYLIQAFYNALRGKVDLKNFYICIGNTNSSKGTTCNAMELAFGDFVGTFNGETLAYTNSTADEAMKMRPFYIGRHKRIMFSSEINMKAKLSGNMIKKVASGGDKLQGRGMRENEVEFYCQSSYFAFINDLPPISPMDDAVKTRTKFIEYPYSFVNKTAEECTENQKPADPDIKQTMRKKWFIYGLQHLILDFGRELMDKMNMQEPLKMGDIAGNWTNDMTLEGKLKEDFILTGKDDDKVSRDELREWRKKSDFDMSDNKFYRELRALKLNEKKTCGKRYFTGIKLRVDEEDSDEETDEE